MVIKPNFLFVILQIVLNLGVGSEHDFNRSHTVVLYQYSTLISVNKHNKYNKNDNI